MTVVPTGICKGSLAVSQICQKARYDKFLRRVGGELEVQLANRFGILLSAKDFLKSHPHLQGEYRKSQVEWGSNPSQIGPGAFVKMLQAQRDFFNQISRYEYFPYPTNVFTDRARILGESDVSDSSPRYGELSSIWKKANPNGLSVLGRKVEDSFSLLSYSSIQFHLAVKPEEVPHALNVAYALAAPSLAPFCSGGRFLGGDTGMACVRPFVWRGLFPGRTGVSLRNSWASKIEEHLAHIKSFPYWLNPETSDGHKGDGNEEGLSFKLKDFNLLASTLWPDVRLKWFVVEGEKIDLTIEARHQGASSLLDNVAGQAFWTGLMTYFMNKYSQDEFTAQFGEHYLCEENFMKVAKDGENAKIRWMGEDVLVRDLILKKLLPFAEEGLSFYEITDSEAKYFLEIVEKNLTIQNLSGWVREVASRFQEKGADAIDNILQISVIENISSGSPVYEWKV